MGSIFDERGGTKKLRSGTLVVNGPKTVVRLMNYNNDGVSPGWPTTVQDNGQIITSSTSNGNQICATGAYADRIKVGAQWKYPCVFRGIIYTHRQNLVNAGDKVGNLLCLGVAPDVISDKSGDRTENSRICIVMKKAWQKD